MQAAGVAVTADQRVAIGVEEQQLRREAVRQLSHRVFEHFRRFRHVAHVDADRRGDIAFRQRIGELRQQHHRQVVNAVKPMSSSARKATDFPEPERPLTIISTMWQLPGIAAAFIATGGNFVIPAEAGSIIVKQ